MGPDVAVYHCEAQDHGLAGALDHQLIEQAQPALERGESVRIDTPIRNTNRTVGAMLSGQVARRYGNAGLPDDTIVIQAHGTGGQSFGAFLAHGITLILAGEANDYVGKGLGRGAADHHAAAVVTRGEIFLENAGGGRVYLSNLKICL